MTTLPCGQRECRPLLALLDMNARERARRYERGRYDTRLGQFVREQAARGDGRAVGFVYEGWRVLRGDNDRAEALTAARSEEERGTTA